MREDILDILARQLEIKKVAIKDKQDLKKDLKADSMDLAEIVMSLEEKFQIKISSEESERLTFVKDILSLVKKKL